MRSPMRSSPSPSSTLGLLATLYFSQGLPFGLFTQALPAVMRQQGISLAAIGLSSALALPWALKFLWAPWIDRGGRRRRWLVPLQLSAVLVLLGLSLADPARSLTWLVIGVLLTNLLASTQDIATDGLAVDLLSPRLRGLGNGIQVAGYRVGMIVGGGALLVAFERLGWTWTFMGAAGLMLLATIPVAMFDERPRPAAEPAQIGVLEALRHFAGDRGRRRWLLVLALYKAGDYLGTSMLRPMLVDQGLGLAELGVILGAVGFSAGLLGALVGGASIQRLGRRRALMGLGALQALSVASYGLATLPNAGAVGRYGPVVFEHFASGMATAALFTMMMDRCRPTHAATDYTLQASLVVLATGIASMAGGSTAQWLGYGPNFVLGGLVSLAALGLVSWALPAERRALA